MNIHKVIEKRRSAMFPHSGAPYCFGQGHSITEQPKKPPRALDDLKGDKADYFLKGNAFRRLLEVVQIMNRHIKRVPKTKTTKKAKDLKSNSNKKEYKNQTSYNI